MCGSSIGEHRSFFAIFKIQIGLNGFLCPLVITDIRRS